jgi:RNA polymerase sigma factor (sigma-70 family)
MSMPGLPPDVERMVRELVPRVLGALVRRCRDFTAAEDAMQEALLSAVAEWPARGIPQNPGGWLFNAASRSLADLQRSEHARRRRETVVAAAATRVAPQPAGVDELDLGSEDDTLLLLFSCCHPALTPASAIALTLRAVGGLTTAEIASAFLVPEATMAQRISRAKRTIQDSGVPFALPDAAEARHRLAAVLHVLYLIFNEGYVGSSGQVLVRVELATEAIRLARALRRARPDEPEVAGLLALMLLTDARRHARTGPLGELIPLPEQDRARWDRAAIAEGTALVTEALARGAAGTYQIQAAIAALHDEAPSTDETDWPQILALYGLLRRMSDNPMVAINEAVAAAMVHGPEAGLRLVEAIATDARISGHHRLDAVRGHLYERAGDHAAAERHFRAAAAGTKSLPERNYLLEKAARLHGGGAG